MKLFNKLTLIIVFLGGINSSLSFSVDVSSWPINSVGANSKLRVNLSMDLLVFSATNNQAASFLS